MTEDAQLLRRASLIGNMSVDWLPLDGNRSYQIRTDRPNPVCDCAHFISVKSVARGVGTIISLVATVQRREPPKADEQSKRNR